ncbi:MogA/MoaB family molybdenum cofactor biosynthesis protein [Natronomonas sp. EA1]|uniref:MogA/MoaB family molybdenum cofactor biosynthesis protein n=1 Tax=Natronomonas sp. EA1 TaxID=3421655 RepID=UPI003EB9A09B
MSDHAPEDDAEEGNSHDHSHDEQHHDDNGGDHHQGDGHGHHEPHDHDEDHSHDHHHHDLDTVRAAVVTVSSSRSVDDDPAGDAIIAAFEDAGHEVSHRELVNDDFDGVQGIVDRLVDRKDVDVVVTTGGTGVTPDDVTVEAVEPLVEKQLPGFGELFRRESYEEIGSRVVGTRATAGVASGVLVFCLPGSENAARLGADIIVSEAPHLVGLARRDEEDEE